MEKYYILIMVGVLAILYIFLNIRQKRQNQKNLEMINNFKVGDKVCTHIGIYGKIKRIYNTSYGKTCVIEVGTTNKVDIEMDMRYVAALDEKVAVPDDPKPETKTSVENKKEENNNSQDKETTTKETKKEKTSNQKSKNKK